MPQSSQTPSKLWYLKHINLFSAFSQSELQEMNRITHMEEIKKRQPIYLPGDPSNTVYLLKKGRVKISSVAANGRVVTFEILEPGEIFGELEVLEDSPRESYAETLDDTLICAISREDFDGYLRNHPDMALKLTKLIGLRLRKIQNRVEDLVFRDVPARIAHLLLELQTSEGVQEGAGIRIRAKLTHQEMANLIGSSRETVSAILGQFRDRGFIQTKARSIIILDSNGLSQLIS